MFVTDHDRAALQQRVALADAARKAGCEVWIAAPDARQATIIKNFGFNYSRYPLSLPGSNVAGLYKLYHEVKPDLVHHFSVPSIFPASLVPRLHKNMAVVTTVTGKGIAFLDQKQARFLDKLPSCRAIFHTPEARQLFVESGVVTSEQARLIRGTGVDCTWFKPSDVQGDPDKPVILLASNMDWDQGIKEFVGAARRVRAKKPNARFVLANTEEAGPEAVPISQMKAWTREGFVEWWGYIKNKAQVMQEATIVTLPAYEPRGVPRELLEGAASGRPLIATDRPGCQEIVRNGITGTLIPPYDSQALANAILGLLNDPETAERYGQAGRTLAVNQFSQELVFNETIGLYKELLMERFPEKVEQV